MKITLSKEHQTEKAVDLISQLEQQIINGEVETRTSTLYSMKNGERVIKDIIEAAEYIEGIGIRNLTFEMELDENNQPILGTGKLAKEFNGRTICPLKSHETFNKQFTTKGLLKF